MAISLALLPNMARNFKVLLFSASANFKISNINQQDRVNSGTWHSLCNNCYSSTKTPGSVLTLLGLTDANKGVLTDDPYPIHDHDDVRSCRHRFGMLDDLELYDVNSYDEGSPCSSVSWLLQSGEPIAIFYKASKDMLHLKQMLLLMLVAPVTALICWAIWVYVL